MRICSLKGVHSSQTCKSRSFIWLLIHRVVNTTVSRTTQLTRYGWPILDAIWTIHASFPTIAVVNPHSFHLESHTRLRSGSGRCYRDLALILDCFPLSHINSTRGIGTSTQKYWFHGNDSLHFTTACSCFARAHFFLFLDVLPFCFLTTTGHHLCNIASVGTWAMVLHRLPKSLESFSTSSGARSTCCPRLTTRLKKCTHTSRGVPSSWVSSGV